VLLALATVWTTFTVGASVLVSVTVGDWHGGRSGSIGVADLTLIPGIATGTQKEIRIASGAVLGHVNRRDGFAPGAVLTMKFTIEPGFGTVRDVSPPLDRREAVEVTLPSGLAVDRSRPGMWP
jgi:hypothetical protein